MLIYTLYISVMYQSSAFLPVLWLMCTMFLLTDLWSTSFKSQLRKGKLSFRYLSQRQWLAGSPVNFTCWRICASTKKYLEFLLKRIVLFPISFIFMIQSPNIFSLKYSPWVKCYMMQHLTSDQQLWKGSYASTLLILCMPSNPPMAYTLPPNTAILCLHRPIFRYSICIHLLMEALYFHTSCFVSLPPAVYTTCQYDSRACIYSKSPTCLHLRMFFHNRK